MIMAWFHLISAAYDKKIVRRVPYISARMSTKK